MFSKALLTIIRNVRDDEYETLGRMHAEAFLQDPMIQLIFANINPQDKFQWLWIDGAKASVAKGDSTVILIERTDTKEILGFAWTQMYTRENPPKYPDTFHEGFNIEEFARQEEPTLAWLERATEIRVIPLRCPIVMDRPDICEFAIAPGYQSQGFGTQLMQETIKRAKAQGLNIALAGASGKSRFCDKFGFREVAPHVMLANGTVEGINVMFLEQFRPSPE